MVPPASVKNPPQPGNVEADLGKDHALVSVEEQDALT